MQRWLSWSKAHDWKSCVRLITDRGFESHPLREKSSSSTGLGDFFCAFLMFVLAYSGGRWHLAFCFLIYVLAYSGLFFTKTIVGGALCGQHSEDRGGGRSVLKRRSVPPPLPSETSHPSSLIQAVMRLRRVVGSEC